MCPTDETDKLISLEIASRAARNNDWPFSPDTASRELDSQKSHVDWLISHRDLLLGMCKGTYELSGGRIFDGRNLWEQIKGTYGFTDQALQVFRTAAMAHGLIGDEDAIKAKSLDLRWQDAQAEAVALEEAREFETLSKAIDHVLGAVSDRQKALILYNRDPNPRSEEKIDRWVRALVTAKLLGPEWLAGRKVGEFLAKMRTLAANKMLTHKGENK